MQRPPIEQFKADADAQQIMEFSHLCDYALWLEEQVRKYGKHMPQCAAMVRISFGANPRDVGQDCTCGFSAVEQAMGRGEGK